MKNHSKMVLDLSDIQERFINLMYLFPNGEEKEIADYTETNNPFGWNVSSAEIEFDDNNSKLVGFRLLTEDGIEQSHSKRYESERLAYWRHEFIGRELEYSPDPFEPNLEKFLQFYYKGILKDSETLNTELSLPVVFYELSGERVIKNIRYALSINSLFTKPLIYISVVGGYLQSISDWQGIESRHMVHPTPDYPHSYLLQRFNKEGGESLHDKSEIESFEEKELVFRGFTDYKVKYYSNIEKELEFVKYGFYAHDLRKIILETELLLKYIPTVNYHLIQPCNMRCRHCFSDFEELDTKLLPFKSAKRIIDEIASVKSFKKLNFSGGEPTIYPGIEKLVKHAKSLGLVTSMITNGFLLVERPNLFNALIGHLDLLAFSLDSFDDQANVEIGRHVKGKTLPFEKLMQLAENCRKNKINIKVNTVVTKLNYNKILADRIVLLKPIRWKILKMLPVQFQNDKAIDIHPSEEEFNEFLRLNKLFAEASKIKVVSENNEEMTGSYLMIGPDGRFFNNIEQQHNYSPNILDVGIKEALSKTPLLREVFYKREGDYSCN